MQKKYIIISAITILILIIIGFIILTNKTSLSPTQSILENCNTISYNSEGKTNIVFFSSKEDAEKYSNFLFTIKPLSENKEEFNLFYIDDYKPECELYEEIAILCYSKELIKKASSCPNDYIVVIKDEDQNIRSSNYMNVMSINSKHPLTVFPHEFGHAFITLAEEYTPAKIPRKSENCVSDCEKFKGETDGCFQGCSKTDHIRSINNGIMRTLSSTIYGIFNEKLILEKINKNKNSITGFATSTTTDCANQKYYLIEAKYNNEIQILSQNIEQGCVGKNGAGLFEYNLITTNDNKIQTEEFNPELIFTDAEGQEQIDGEVFENTGMFLLKIPIIENTKTLEILKDSKTIKEINLENMNSRPCKIK